MIRSGGYYDQQSSQFYGQTAAWNTKEIGWLAAKFPGRVSKCNNTTTVAAFGWWQVLISQPGCFHNPRPVLNVI